MIQVFSDVRLCWLIRQAMLRASREWGWNAGGGSEIWGSSSCYTEFPFDYVEFEKLMGYSWGGFQVWNSGKIRAGGEYLESSVFRERKKIRRNEGWSQGQGQTFKEGALEWNWGAAWWGKRKNIFRKRQEGILVVNSVKMLVKGHLG